MKAGMTLYRHGFRWRIRGFPLRDDDGEIVGRVEEPAWKEADLTPEQEAELSGWIAEHRAARPQDDPLFVRWATLENNGVEHTHRRGKLLIDYRPAYGYECSMCRGYIVTKDPGDFPFYGGPADGRWLVTDGRHYWDVPVMPALTVAAPYDAAPSLTLDRVTYERRRDAYYAR